MFPNIPKGEIIGLDFETTGLKYWSPDFHVFGVAVAYGNSNSRYWDVRDTPGVVEWLRDLLPGRKVIAQNAQFEYQCTRQFKIDPRSVNWYCTMVTECLINEHRLTYGLDAIAGYNGVESDKLLLLEGIRVAMGWSSTAEVLRRLSEVPPRYSSTVRCVGRSPRAPNIPEAAARD